MAEAPAELLWAPHAWLAEAGGRPRWRERVLARIGPDGCWAGFTADQAQPPAGATILPGPLLPALVNAHGHAFQRAAAGYTERRDAGGDDFWSWREQIYRIAQRVGPDELRALAAQLYVELLAGGYTQVCEFHYLQHDPAGEPYPDPLELSWALADAAAEAGIGLTLLPVVYQRAGFSEPALGAGQRRFALDPAAAWQAAARIAAAGRPLLTTGLAIHSLRAVAPSSIAALARLAAGYAGPIHIHVAEQAGEVEDCRRATGRRPVEWLAQQGWLDRRWQLIHATHTTPAEIDAVAASGAGIVICPTTEADLGDGLADLPCWLAAGVPVAIGSDSQVCRDALTELRWLEYGQRLVLRRRNIAAAPAAGWPSTAERLYALAVTAGGQAAGAASWGLVPGARADALVVDPQAPALLGSAPPQLLDALVFSAPSAPWRDVLVAGRWVLRAGRHPRAAAIAERCVAALAAIRSDRTR